MDNSITKLEEKILRFWNDRDIFKRSLEARLGKKKFVFFEGPPTANGRPGIHHFIGRVFKDLWPRYKTMRGYYVSRKAGWDTHGLPVEIEVEKELGFTNKKEIEKYGIAKFNAKAKKSVWKYKDEWQKFTHRIGFWIDLQHPYITYDPHYIESLWSVIAQIDKKNLLYQGHKIIPWCTRCGTGLSSHEMAQGYKEVTDDAVTWKFRVKGQESNIFLLAWTTTPWSTISTMGLSVGPEFTYVKAKVGEEYYIVVKERADVVLGKHEVVEEFPGSKLVGMTYEPLLDLKGPYKVYPADYVELTDGTGIVTINGSYGEIDMEQAKRHKLPIVVDVDPDGKFNKHAGPYAGMTIREGQEQFIADMKAKGLVWKVEPYLHSYPHCWRCKTALIYYAKDSWFVAMSKLRKQLLKNNAKINWYPEHLKEGRFGEFLKEVKDWAFSRERYWGTPLPVWKCAEGHQRVIGSFEELEAHRYRKPNTFILLRHGESTKNNPLDIVAGQLDHDTYHLTQYGRDIVDESVKKLKEEGGIDLIYSSPFLRAKETAELVAKEFGHSVHIEDRLKEIFDGTHWQGKSVSDFITARPQRALDDEDGDSETWGEVLRRMSAAIRDLDAKYEGKRILIVSHGDPLWLLKYFFLNLPRVDMKREGTGLYPQKGVPESFILKNYPYNRDGELDPHRPYIDEIVLKCDQCGGKMTRVKEVCDVWFDSGAMPWASQVDGYPADFISEAIDQTRGWFYTLLAVSTVLGKKAPYKNVVCYSHVLDAKGKKMSKSIGNVVNPWDVIEQYGVDPTRWYFYSVNNPGDPKLFDMADVGKVSRGFITTLMNCLRFYELNEKPGASHGETEAKPREPIDAWMLSRLHRLIAFVTTQLDGYNPTAASRAIENFVMDDLSNWWIRRSRGREDMSELLRYALVELSKLLAPFIPFTADHMYKIVSNRKESVHLEDWPKAKEKFVDLELEQNMTKVRDVVALALAQRKSASLKVRQPLASLSVKEKLDSTLERYIKEEVNVKEILFAPSQEDLVRLDTHITEALKIEGYAREISRAIQEMRKEAGYQIGDTVEVFWESTSPEAKSAIAQLEDLQPKSGKVFDVQKEFELVSGVKVWLGIRK